MTAAQFTRLAAHDARHRRQVARERARAADLKAEEQDRNEKRTR